MAYNEYMGFSNWKKTVDPITGYKKSFIGIKKDASGKELVVLKPIQGHMKKTTLLNDTNGCPSYQSHTGKPSRFCTCGFHAYTTMENALTHGNGIKIPIIKTVSSGKIIMYSRGVRAAKQRVAEVFMEQCFTENCLVQSDRLILLKEGNTILQMCKLHASGHRKENIKTFLWLEEKMNASLFDGEPHISVKPLDETIVPWDGSEPISPPEPLQQNRTAGILVGAGLAFLGSMVVRDIVKTFSS